MFEVRYCVKQRGVRDKKPGSIVKELKRLMNTGDTMIITVKRYKIDTYIDKS